MSLESPRIADAKAMLIAGLDRRYSCENTGGIPAQWSSFGPFIGRMPGQVGSVAYGLCHHMDAAGFDYLAGVEIAAGTSLPEGLRTEQLPAQRYATFAHHGHVSTLSRTIDAIWQEWLPASGESVADNPVVIERYGESFNPATGLGDVEVWIPIRS